MKTPPIFKYFDGVTEIDVWRAKFAHQPLSEAQRLSLVKACKSPTDEKQSEIARNLFFCRDPKLLPVRPPQEFEYSLTQPIKKTVPAYAVFQFREWADEYRIRSRIDCPHRLPPIPDTKRSSWMLTSRGARKISESCAYMSTVNGGYTTFLTLTFDAQQRERIANGEITIQREVSRFFDGMQKIYQRDGWAEKMGCPTLAYCWVVEVPANKNGEENPHCHVLIRWKVPHTEFKEWAARLERLWGMGFAHLEKIENHEAAGAYMAKAAGYITKANGQEDQGYVKGNRYGISEVSRAPGWVTIDEKALHSMGMIIAEVHEHLSQKHGEKFIARKRLNLLRDSIRKTKDIDPALKRKRLAAIGNKLAQVRKELNALPAIASKYQIILKGQGAFDAFIDYARGDRESYILSSSLLDVPRESWLPDKPRVPWDSTLPSDKWSSPFREKPQSLWRQRQNTLLSLNSTPIPNIDRFCIE